MVLSKTIMTFRSLTDYHKSENGAWTAEFHGALDVKTEGATLEQCRDRALDALDEKLAAWITATAENSESGSATR
jgi:predicted RNase H-like HicB family nuclease